MVFYSIRKLTMFEPFAYHAKTERLIRHSRSNLVVVAPTGAGKTTVAFQALEHHGAGCYIVPTRALAYEKVRQLQERFPEAKVVIANKDYDLNAPDFAAADYRVLTQFALARMMAYFDNFACLVPVVVVDEFQNFDQTAEMNLVVMKRLFPSVRIVALSATIRPGDRSRLVDWLDAELVVSEIRPVPLHQRIVVGRPHSVSVLKPNDGLREQLPVRGLPLERMLEVVRREDKNPVLVWTPFRKLAYQHCQVIFDYVTQQAREVREISPELMDLAERLPCRDSAENKLLKRMLPYGIGVHHGGFTGEERELVHRLAEQGKLSEIVTCYTLLQGVNLPAKHVLIPEIFQESPHRYGAVPDGFEGTSLSASQFHQLIGRAGRPQFDTDGYCWIYVQSDHAADTVQRLFRAEATPLQSELGEPDFFVRYLPQFIERGVETRKELIEVLHDSFWHQLYPKRHVGDAIGAALECLDKAEAIQMKKKRIELTPRGKILARLSLHPEELSVIERLIQAKSLTLHSWVNYLFPCSALLKLEVGEVELELVQQFGFSVHHRPEATRTASELADYLQRMLELAGRYLEMVSVEATYVERWEFRVLRKFLYGRMVLAESLEPIAGRSRMKRLVRHLGTEVLCKAPRKLLETEREAVILCLCRGEFGDLDLQKLAEALHTTEELLRLPLERSVS